MPFRRFSSMFVLFAVMAFQSVRRSSPFSSPSVARGNPKPVGSERRLAVFAERRSHSSDLSTALEWLAKERHPRIGWFPDTDASGADEDVDVASTERMPIYPLEAVHVPYSGENCTIVNIERRNVNMVTDLVNGKWERPLFCASLQARDTARIASVATVMQLLDVDDRSIRGATAWSGERLPALHRVVATCMAVGIADIVSVEERDCEEEDYLVARVRVRHLPQTVVGDSDATSQSNGGEDLYSMAKQTACDYQQVRSIYSNSRSLAANELPKFARQAVQTLPTFDADAVRDETAFWQVVETWQMLCNTILHTQRTRLQQFVNELSVRAARRAEGGPLELPVKRERLPAEVRWELNNMERRALQDFTELGMDPILDFQELLSAGVHRERVEKLARMIAGERSRLEAKESLMRAFLREELGEEAPASSYSDDGKTVFD